MLIGVARHSREEEALGDASGAGLDFQAAICPFPPPKLEQDDPSGAFISVCIKCVCKPSDFHGLASWRLMTCRAAKGGESKEFCWGFPENFKVFSRNQQQLCHPLGRLEVL